MCVSELYFYLRAICTLINRNFKSGLFFGGLDAGLVKFEQTNLTKTS